MKYLSQIFIFAILWSFASCDNDAKTPDDPWIHPVWEPPVGISWQPQKPTPDKALEIYFKADSKSALYKYSGDVYAHIGIVDGDEWLYVPADWNENTPKCKMEKISENAWKLSLKPSVREWFGANGNQIIPRLGIVVRSADGNKKGVENDTFIPVNDTSTQTVAVEKAPLPDNCKLGLNFSGNSVTFALYDKDKNDNHYENVYVIGSFNDWTKSKKYLMKRDENKGIWWLKIDNLDPNKEYAFQYYLIGFDKTLKIADPYSEKVLSPDDKYISSATYPSLSYPKGANGVVSAFTINSPSFQWAHSADFTVPEKKDLVIYELLVRDFSKSGDIQGVLNNLDYISDLGVNAIELMPVQEFDGNDSWGYNPCFYFALDKAYGTKNAYKRLIDECHKRGIAVILDVVYNHTTGLSPFAKLYWDNANNRPAANNPWLNVKAPHPYSVFEDFNHKSPLTQEFVKRNFQFLLKEYKVDGFRFDLSKGFTQNKSTEATAGNYDADRVEILSNYYDAIKEVNINAFVILEHFANYDEQKKLADKGCMLWQNMNHNFGQSAMGYADGSSFKRLDAISNSMPLASCIAYMESHDEERIPFKQKKYGVAKVKQDKEVATDRLIANIAFFMLNRNPKMIWQFEELGYDISINEGGRTGKKPSYLTKKNEPIRAKLYKAYQTLIKFRLEHKDLFTPSVPFSWDVSAENWNKVRSIKITKGGKTLHVIGNFDVENAKTHALENGTWYDVLDNKEPLSGGEITVAPNTVKVLVNFE